MKEVPPSLTADYPTLVLYRDDLTALQETLKDVRVFRLQSGKYEFESVSEMLNYYSDRKVDQLPDIQISTKEPYVDISLGQLTARLHVSSQDDSGPALFLRLNAILERSRRRAWWAYSWPFVFVLLMISNALAVAMEQFKATAALYVALLPSAWLFWALFIRLRHHSQINLEHQETRSFWRRKKDDVLLAAASGVIGALIGVAATLATQYFSK